jgi:hypothetical protein
VRAESEPKRSNTPSDGCMKAEYARLVREAATGNRDSFTTVRNACLMKRRRHVGDPKSFVSIEQGVETTDGTIPIDVSVRCLLDRELEKG